MPSAVGSIVSLLRSYHSGFGLYFHFLFSATYSDDTTSDGAAAGLVGDALGATVAARGRLNSTGHDLNFHEFINRDHSKLE